MTTLHGSRALVTGGAGFIGSHLVDELLAQGVRVTVVDDLSSGKEENLFHSESRLGLKFVRGSICDRDLMEHSSKGADYVFHLAAIASVPRSLEDPLLSHDVNLTGTLNVLVAARKSGVRKLVFSSSSAVYGESPSQTKKETQPPRPCSPYALTKLASETYCRLFDELFQLPTVSLRYFNVYGPRQSPRSEYAAVIPRFIQRVSENSPPVIFGDGEQSRDFVFVEDVVKANLVAVQAQANGVYNIASGEKTTLYQLAVLICELAGKPQMKPVYAPERPGDIKHSRADVGKALRMGFKPEWDLTRGLLATMESLG